MGRGRGQKGQKWDKENQCWYFPTELKVESRGDTTEKIGEETKLTVTAVNDLLETALRKQREEIMKEVNKEMAKNVVDITRARAIDKAEITEEDMLETPKHYFAWGRSLTIDSYSDRGRPIKTPYGNPIVFGFMPPNVEFDAEGNRVELHWCMCKIWSKKEVEFIEKSPQFIGGIIMERVTDLKYEDARNTTSRMHAITYVAGLKLPELVNACRGRNISVSNDFNKMRDELIKNMTSEVLGDLPNKARHAAVTSATANKELLV